jgi:class 3 adenylate cyclase/DNA-binding transcriptional MerR regulator
LADRLGYPACMVTLTGAQLAARAGVSIEFVDRLCDLGLLAPAVADQYTAGDIRRVRTIHVLDRAGLPLEGIAAAVSSGHASFAFLDLDIYGRVSPLSAQTFAEVSASTGIHLDLLLVVREAIGLAVPDSGDPMRDDELSMVPVIQRLLSFGSRPTNVERLLRVYGDALRRAADTETAWWHDDLELPLLTSGVSTGEMLETINRSGAELAPLLDQLLLAIRHAHQGRAWTRLIIDDIEAGLRASGVASGLTRLPAVCFLDISGYSRLTEERGDLAAADLAASFARVVQRTSARHGGQPIKWLGDGVMLLFDDPRGAVVACLGMVVALHEAGIGDSHVGIHTGPVLFQEGDYFGRTVNVASRIADYARPGEVLVSQEVMDAIGSLDVAVRPIGLVDLKGVGSVRLSAVLPTGSS